jgi:threonine-phosphate decarboxylase
VVEGWVRHSGGRHHGAHAASAARSLDVSEQDLLDFSQNINPLGVPSKAMEEAQRALREEAGRYPDAGYHRLRQALASYLGVSPAKILPTNGGAEALFLAARGARAGGRALILEPTFSEYAAAARAGGLEPVRRVARRRKHGFRLDPGCFEDLDGVSLVFLCNPNNPTGDFRGREEVLEIAERVAGSGTVLVIDEAFADFVPEISVVAETSRDLYVARSFTKFFGIPGLRLGCLVCADPGLLQQFQPSWPVNTVAAAAATAAVRDVDFANSSVAEVGRLREELFEGLEALPGLTPFPGAANFMLVQGPEGLSGRLTRRGILVRGCELFPGLGPGYFRVAVRGADENRRLLAGMREEL